MRRPAILFISYYFHPSREVGARRPTETVKFLADRGFDITVIRAIERNAPGNSAPQELADARILSVRVPRKTLTRIWIRLKARFKTAANASVVANERGDPGARRGEGKGRRRSVKTWLRRQFLAFDTSFQGNKLWLCKLLLRVVRLRPGGRYDLIVASGPPFVGSIGGLFASKVFNAPLLLDFRDPWYLHGDKERKTEILGHPIATWENSFGQRCVSRASIVAVASPGIRRHCEEVFDVRRTRIELVRNGYDASAIVEARPPTGRLEMLYAGSLYWNRDPFPFLQTLKEALSARGIDRAAIGFTMVGDCAAWEGIPLQPWIEEQGLADTVRILPGVGQNELRQLVASSNVLVNFAQGQPRQIPAKSYEYLAAGRDLIIVAETNSDVADLFQEAGIGQTVSPDDTSALKAAILDYYEKYVEQRGGQDAELADMSAFSRAAQSARFHAIVQELTKPEADVQALRES